jgi:hypothetical protein
MKVMCINNTNRLGDKMSIVVGEIYTASQCEVYPENYNLAEIPTVFGRPVSYNKRHFAPLSDKDETETEVYKNLQTQTV